MSILWTLVVGFFVGLLARFFLPGRDPAGLIVTSLIGVLGSFVAAYVGSYLGWYLPGEGVGLLASILGAMFVLLVFRVIRGKA
ncbi:MAG TPA: GlsB/YeaQ/YmgE family stress response membrane protein [Bdellovibrionota bacterium]|nr:GlsB/YeaQ/YmgE family stress response membrane protein [Bdellovibrionota bacterium]